MTHRLAIDADSMLYTACYRHQDTMSMEKMYAEFCGLYMKVKEKLWEINPYLQGDEVVINLFFSPKVTFRNQLYPMYKANRKPSSVDGIKYLKELVIARQPEPAIQGVNIEADDMVIRLAHQGWNVATIDKDVINACPTHCYNYKKHVWNPPNSEENIESWYNYQALMGDSGDNIKGALGIGKVKARLLMGANPSWEAYSNVFDSEEDAIMNMRLVRMDQYDENTGDLVLWTPDKFHETQSF